MPIFAIYKYGVSQRKEEEAVLFPEQQDRRRCRTHSAAGEEQL